MQTKIETLKHLTEEREADNQGLRQELAITRERLQKAEESKKMLLASIVKLQDIVSSKWRLFVEEKIIFLTGSPFFSWCITPSVKQPPPAIPNRLWKTPSKVCNFFQEFFSCPRLHFYRQSKSDTLRLSEWS
jgi:hypothetical protein